MGEVHNVRVEWLWELLFPRRCIACGKGGAYVCDRCLGEVERVELICPMCCGRAVGGETHLKCGGRRGLDGLVVIWRYAGVVKRSVSIMKYGLRFAVGREMAGRLVEEIDGKRRGLVGMDRFLAGRPVVVPVPSYWMRERRRGFNQAMVLACEVGKRWGLEVRSLLKKTRETEQVGRNRRERLEIPTGVYVMEERIAADVPARALIVDDVWTTGATVRACARVLKSAGVREVWGLAVGR